MQGRGESSSPAARTRHISCQNLRDLRTRFNACVRRFYKRSGYLTDLVVLDQASERKSVLSVIFVV